MSELTKKRVSVSFAGNDDVVQHISSLNARKGRVRQIRQKTSNFQDGSCSEDEEESDEEQNVSQNDDVYKPSEALAEDGLTGGEVFGFKSIKRTTQMAAAANRSVQALTPASPAKPSPKPTEPTTPKSILKKTRAQVLSETGQTPLAERSTRRNKRLATLTSQRIKARQTVAAESSDDSVSSESSDEAEEDLSGDVSDESSNSYSSKSKPKPGEKVTKTDETTAVKSTPRRGGRKKADIDDTVKTDSVDAYFDAHSSSHILTSDRTLSRLQTPRMDHQALSQVLNEVEQDFREEKEALLKDYRRQFKKWMFMLCHGYNLMFHGLGSKRHLLEEFRNDMLEDYNHVIVNGYFPSLTIKSILTSITEEVLEHDGTFRTPIEQCDFIRTHFECGDQEDFFLIVHNIDGAMLRAEKSQTVLSLLAQIRGFHIVASIDHINAPLLWDNNKCSRFNWLWLDVTTYEPYVEETSYENSLLVQQSGVLALSSLTHVLRSLTPNARGIFMLLVKHQMEHAKDNASYQGLSFPDLYQKCREDFLVNSDITLRTQLTEFKDHKLIKLKKGGLDGIEYLNIPLDNATLKEFIEQQESEEQS